jgi:hypothetical protein
MRNFSFNDTVVKVCFWHHRRFEVFQQNLTGTDIPGLGNSAGRLLDIAGAGEHSTG